jgi:hypothetical protein
MTSPRMARRAVRIRRHAEFHDHTARLHAVDRDPLGSHLRQTGNLRQGCEAEGG